ncbi:MAG: thioredoxin fold domain-containing protein [Gammaproteobacteria bacterium]|nr:thioredoxin fold domain-containing protein [Gammaproteobacteria bacterium]
MRKSPVFVFIVFLTLSFSTPVLSAEIAGAGQFDIPSWFKESFLDLRDDIEEATAHNKRLMIFFHQNGCPYCAELINTNFSQKDIVDYARKNLDILDINIWGDREIIDPSGKTFTEKTFASELKVWFTPTVLFFNEKGEVILRINGYYPPHQFMSALKYVSGRQEKLMTFRDYYAQQVLDKSSGILVKESFFLKPPYELKALGKNKPLVVFFEQKQCPGCDTLHKEILGQKETIDLIKQYNAIQLDMWSNTPVITPQGESTTARDWAKALGITYAPSAVLFDKGKEVIRIEAFLKGYHTQSILDYVASGAYKTQPNLQRFIQERADALIEQGKEVDIWK